MATYKGIQGYTIQSLASDPPGAQSVGQIWYNSTSNVWKVGSSSPGAWASAPSLTTARSATTAYGTTTASICISGNTPGPTPGGTNYTPTTEEYDGTSWTQGGTVTTYGTQEAMGTGTATAGLWFGGYEGNTDGGGIKLTCEEYDGTSWTAVNPITEKRKAGAAAGSVTAALLFAGQDGFVPGGPGSVMQSNVQEYNGTSWTNVNNIDTQMSQCGGSMAGTQTAAVRALGALTGHGAPQAASNTVSDYDGTCWTAGTAANTARPDLGFVGIQTSAIVMGGWLPPGSPLFAITEQWNGTAWTEVADLGTGRAISSGAGASVTSGLCVAGRNPPSTPTNNVEEWSSPAFVTQTVTTS